MPGRTHQSLAKLFRRDPNLAVELAWRVAGWGAPQDFVVDTAHPVIQRPGSRINDRIVEIDLLLDVHLRNPDGSRGELVRRILIVEVQLGRDRSRIQAWMNYYLAAAEELRVGYLAVDMLVVCPHAAVRRWLDREVLAELLRRPLLLEPDHVPWIDDVEVARARPEAAVLSAVFHGRDPDAAAVVNAASLATQSLEPELRDRYQYLIQTSAHRDMDIPQPNQEPDRDEVPSEWEQGGLTWAQHGERFAAQGRREGLEQGRAEGLREGRAEGLACAREALFAMFKLVGLRPTPEQRSVIEACDDPEQLGRWLEQIAEGMELTNLVDNLPR